MSRPSDELLLAIHGPTAAAHELHTEQPGSFEAAMQALARARAQGQRVVVASRLTRSSCRSLVDLADRLVAYGVAGWAIVWPVVEAHRQAVAARTVPRLGIAVPHALRAVQRAQRRGLPAVLVGMPLCVLGPFAAQRLPSSAKGIVGGAHAAVCASCSFAAECAGVDPWYLERFGAEELRPVPAIDRAPLKREVALALVGAVRRSEGAW